MEIVGAPALVPLNEPHALRANVLPSEAPQLIVWSVQEPGATMEGNRFTATEEGDYTVKAASLENLEMYATVTIAARLVQVTKVTIKNKPTEMLLYESRRFEATVEPEGARTAVTWSRCIV